MGYEERDNCLNISRYAKKIQESIAGPAERYGQSGKSNAGHGDFFLFQAMGRFQ